MTYFVNFQNLAPFVDIDPPVPNMFPRHVGTFADPLPDTKQLKINKGSTSLDFRKKMSQVAFSETAYYDSIISNYFNKFSKIHFPKKKIIYGNLIEKLRYGENPHQDSAIYSQNKNIKIDKIHGKQLSYNNYNDIFAALTISKSLPKNTGTVIVKHANPCGVSVHKNNIKSFKSALACDPISAFGGIVSCNFKIKKDVAKELDKVFLEVIVGNGFDKNALQILKRRKNLRIIDSSNFSSSQSLKSNSFYDSILVQSEDKNVFSKKDFKIVSKKKPSKSQFDDLIFAFNVCRFVKSNAIVLANNKSTIGIGSGQPSRLDSCKIAINKMHNISSYKDNRQLGSFVIIDPYNNKTFGAGMIDHALRRSRNISWHKMSINKETRSKINLQLPCVIWFTGLSG